MAERKHGQRRRDRWFAAAYVAGTLGAFAVILVPQDPDASAGPAFYGLWIALYVVTAWAWLRTGPALRTTVVVLLALAAWVIASAVWSEQPLSSAAYGLAFAANVAFVGWMRVRLPLSTVWRIALATIVALAAGGVLLHLVGYEPVRYVDVHGRSTLFGTHPLRGLFNHKITAGVSAVLGVLLSWYLLSGVRRLVTIAGLAVFVVLTGSTGSLLLLVGAAGVLVLLALARSLQLGPDVVVALAALLIVMGALSLTTVAPWVLEAMGRDGSLTGRTDLWAWGWRVALERPVLGWGFFGYAGSERALMDAGMIPRFANYDLPHFHNAYLQNAVDLGVVGVLAPVALALVALYENARRGLRSADRAALASTAMLIVIMIAGLGVHAFVQYNHFLTVAVLASFAYGRSS
jgi:O-antigen ligase